MYGTVDLRNKEMACSHSQCQLTRKFMHIIQRKEPLPAETLYQCADNPYTVGNCAEWKKYGLCESQQSEMKESCKKTCGYCDGKSMCTSFGKRSNVNLDENQVRLELQLISYYEQVLILTLDIKHSVNVQAPQFQNGYNSEIGEAPEKTYLTIPENLLQALSA